MKVPKINKNGADKGQKKPLTPHMQDKEVMVPCKIGYEGSQQRQVNHHSSL